MKINRGFAYAYGWNIYYEKIVGIWTIADESHIANRRAWAYCFLMIITVWLPQVASLPIVWGDMSAMADCLAINVSFSVTIIKITIFQYRRKVIRSIFVTINEDWERVTTKQQLDVMLEIGKISRFISILSFTLTMVATAFFVAVQFWMTMTNGKNLDKDPRLSGNCPFVVYYPFNTTRRFVFLTVYVCQTLCAMSVGIFSAASDCMETMLVLHNFVQTRLAIVVKDTFSLILLVQMLVCSIAFCLQSFIVFTAFADRNSVPIPIFDLIFIVMYAAHTLTHLFMLCYVGDRLLVESTSLTNDFYESEWYNLPSKEAKAFLHVYHRSKIPLEMTAGRFCTFNLQLFNAVLKNSMRYFSMLVAMKERLVDR